MEIKIDIKGSPVQQMMVQTAMSSVIEAIRVFKKSMLAENSSNLAAAEIVESFYTPQHDKPFGESPELNAQMLNPSPENSLERAVSGWLSFHLSPTEKFFGLHSMDFIQETMANDESAEVDVAKALAVRTETIHRIIQSPDNFEVMAQSTREKVKLGIAAKTVDPDPLHTATLSFYPFRQLGLGTSNGRVLDIYMVCEKMNEFAARMRFPGPLFNKEYWKERMVGGIYGGQPEKEYYRLNVPVPVIRRHVEDYLIKDFADVKTRKKVLDLLFPEKKTKGYPGNVQWADIWFRDDMIMSVELKDYRPIMVNKMAPAYNVMCFARGQGEKTLPLLMAITHAMEKTVKAFERTYDPSWSFTDENQRLGIDLTSDGINFKEAGTEDPKPLSLQADMRAPIEYSQYLQMLLDRCLYLDVFELLNKSRMTKAEVQSRDSDDYRKMTLYVVQDQADDLNPLVLNINHLVHQAKRKMKGEPDPLADVKLRALYTSDIAFANKNSLFNKVVRQAQMIEAITKVGQVETPIQDVTNLPGYYADVMVEAGESEILRTQDDRIAREKLRLSRQQIADKTAEAQALGASSEALGSVVQSAGEGGGGAPAGGVPQGG